VSGKTYSHLQACMHLRQCDILYKEEKQKRARD